jgi:ribosomal protein L29
MRMQEATQKIYDGKINTMKNELAALKNQLASNNLEQEKTKKVCEMKFDVK